MPAGEPHYAARQSQWRREPPGLHPRHVPGRLQRRSTPLFHPAHRGRYPEADHPGRPGNRLCTGPPGNSTSFPVIACTDNDHGPARAINHDTGLDCNRDPPHIGSTHRAGDKDRSNSFCRADVDSPLFLPNLPASRTDIHAEDETACQYSYAHTYVHTYSVPHADIDSNPDIYRFGYADPNSHAHGYGNEHVHSNPNSYT